jgi:Ser/Thr protein kinase RdoA (MazF antagonist)
MIEEIKSLIVRNLGGKPSSVEKIGEGLVHRTYTFVFEDDDYVIQFSDPDTDNERALERGSKFYDKSDQLSFPVPELVSGVNTAEIDGQELKYYIAEKIEGKTLEKKITSDLAYQAGMMLAEIHEVEYGESGWLSHSEDSFEIQDFDEGSLRGWIISDNKKDADTLEENDMQKTAEKVRGFFENYGHHLPVDFQPVLCHNDFSQDNILSKNGKITGIIDFDYAFSSHRQRDLVKAMNSFGLTDEDLVSDLQRGYREESDLDESFEMNRLLYNVDTLNRIVASAFRLKNEVTEGDRKRYRRMLNEAIRKAENQLELK